MALRAGKPVLFTLVLLAGLGAIATLTLRAYQDRAGAAASATPRSQVEEARKQLARAQAELKSRVEPGIARLRADREDVRGRLKALGVADSRDLKRDFKAQGLGRELAEVVGYIRTMEQKREALNKSIFDLESMIRSLERKAVVENAGLSDREIAEVNQTVRTIDAQLADFTKAPPEISPAQLDTIIDEELGANSLEGRIERQLEIRKAALAKVQERLAAARAAAAAAPQNARDAENLRTRLERAIRQARDEDRWPLKIAGCTLDEPAAQLALARADTYIARQQGLPAELAPAIEALQRTAGAIGSESAELSKLLEQTRADAGKSDAAAPARAQEAKARIAELTEHPAAARAESLLSGPVPVAEPFVLPAK